MLHVLEDHDEGVPIAAHAVELDNVLVLQVGEQLGLPLEILPGCQGGVLQGLEMAGQWLLATGEQGSACSLLGRQLELRKRPADFQPTRS